MRSAINDHDGQYCKETVIAAMDMHRNIHPVKLILGIMLVATVVVPPFLHMTLRTSSMSAGALLVSGLYVYFYMLYVSLRISPQVGTILIVMAAMVAMVFAQGLISLSIHDEFDVERFSQSTIALLVFILGSFSFARLVRELPDGQSDFSIKTVFSVLLFSGLCGILKYSPFSDENFTKVVLFFEEPSHFALSFLPILLYVVVVSRPKTKLAFITVGLLMAVLLQSLTLVVGVTIIIVLVAPFSRLVFILPVALVLLSAIGPDVIYSLVDFDYYLTRVDLSREAQNLSGLAYMQGWERAFLNLEETYGFGVGFQQFGIVGSQGDIMDDILKLNDGSELNLLDGGSVAAKFIAEFGILGFTVLMVYLVYFAKCARMLRKASRVGIVCCNRTDAFFFACFVMYCMDLFVRGAGYFSPSGFLFLASIPWVLPNVQGLLATSSQKGRDVHI